MFNRNANPNMYSLSNELDRAVGSLVEDLKTSGDFDRTLIVMMGEFGRTPGALNVQGGRDHHKNAMSVVMMGGGVAGNRVIGATNSTGAFMTDPGWSRGRAIVMEDIAADDLFRAWNRPDQEHPGHSVGTKVRVRPQRRQRPVYVDRGSVPMRPSYPNVLLGLVIGVLALADNFEAQAEAQFEARRIIVSASRSTLVAGERLQLSALARNENGASRTDGFDWGSNNDNILTVSSQGVVGVNPLLS